MWTNDQIAPNDQQPLNPNNESTATVPRRILTHKKQVGLISLMNQTPYFHQHPSSRQHNTTQNIITQINRQMQHTHNTVVLLLDSASSSKHLLRRLMHPGSKTLLEVSSNLTNALLYYSVT